MITPHDLFSPTPNNDTAPSTTTARVLLLGVGNWLMGDEGVGIHVVRMLESQPPLFGVRVLDGGTGGINLLIEFDGITDIVMADATIDGRPAGTVTLLRPERVADIPRGLGAHDFGVKDLFAASALLGKMPRIHLFTISVEEVKPMCMELSPPVSGALSEVVHSMHALAARLAADAIAHSPSSDAHHADS